MHVLVCGGAGYIGAHMCKVLADNGHRLTVFDNLSTGHADAVSGYNLVEGDITIPADLERVFTSAKFDAVMHFCAKSIVPESVIQPDTYYRNNVAGTVNLLNAMVRHNVRRFIFSSTASVYGKPLQAPIDEEHVKQPANPYGQSKLIIESLLPDYAYAFGLQSVSLRYFNAAGADPSGLLGEWHEPETHLIPNVLNSLLDSTSHPLQVFGKNYPTPDGTCVRDYIHVLDLCDAHIKALTYLMEGGTTDVFNLGNGEGFSVLQVINCAGRVTGKNVRYTFTEPRPGDVPTLVASAEKAKRVLGWQPKHSDLETIIETAWCWHRSMSQKSTR